MQVFSERPDDFMSDFSKDFESGFLTILKRKYVHLREIHLHTFPSPSMLLDTFAGLNCSLFSLLRHGRVAANVVYQEYIADRNHIHMNATMWDTLSTFIQYLGRTGKATVDQTTKGWFAQYIDRDPAVVARQAR
jgi:hypothetical protein